MNRKQIIFADEISLNSSYSQPNIIIESKTPMNINSEIQLQKGVTANDACIFNGPVTFNGTVAIDVPDIIPSLDLTDLADVTVNANTIQNKDVIIWDSALSKFKNGRPNLFDLISSETDPITTGTNINGVLLRDSSIYTILSQGVAHVDGAGKIVSSQITSADIDNNTIPDSKLQTISTAGKVLNSATTATELNNGSSIVARDASGNFALNLLKVTKIGSHTTVPLNVAPMIMEGNTDIILDIDADNNGTGNKLKVTQNGQASSLLEVNDDGTIYIPNLSTAGVVHSINGGTLASSKVVNADIDDNSINAVKIVNGSINDVQIQENSIPNSKLMTGIDGAKISANTLNASSIISGSITDTQIQENSISNSKLMTGIDGAKISAGTLSATSIVSGSINDVQIQENSIPNSKLMTGIDGAKISANTLSASSIVSGSITNSQIADSTIADAKIVALDGSKVSGNVSLINITASTNITTPLLTPQVGDTINIAGNFNMLGNELRFSNLVGGDLSRIVLYDNRSGGTDNSYSGIGCTTDNGKSLVYNVSDDTLNHVFCSNGIAKALMNVNGLTCDKITKFNESVLDIASPFKLTGYGSTTGYQHLASDGTISFSNPLVGTTGAVQTVSSLGQAISLAGDTDSSWDTADPANFGIVMGSGGVNAFNIGKTRINAPLVLSSVYSDGGSTQVMISDTGNLHVTVSSKRYKESIIDMQDTAFIYSLRPVNFSYIGDKNKIKNWGLIAEEAEKVNKDLVRYKDGLVESVCYEKLPIMMLNEMKKLKAENLKIKGEIESLKLQIIQLMQQMNNASVRFVDTEPTTLDENKMVMFENGSTVRAMWKKNGTKKVVDL